MNVKLRVGVIRVYMIKYHIVFVIKRSINESLNTVIEGCMGEDMDC